MEYIVMLWIFDQWLSFHLWRIFFSHRLGLFNVLLKGYFTGVYLWSALRT